MYARYVISRQPGRSSQKSCEKSNFKNLEIVYLPSFDDEVENFLWKILLKNLEIMRPHIEALITFLLVKIFGLGVIARYHAMRCWRKLEEVFPFSLPDLFKPKC